MQLVFLSRPRPSASWLHCLVQMSAYAVPQHLLAAASLPHLVSGFIRRLRGQDASWQRQGTKVKAWEEESQPLSRSLAREVLTETDEPLGCTTCVFAVHCHSKVKPAGSQSAHGCACLCHALPPRQRVESSPCIDITKACQFHVRRSSA